ncbi:autotransporter-associated beta strand repeat-containing protein, partial [Pseudomonas huaxiensis]|uniref:autotransporter-associated beta strand repeat-containing protein n=1 Tax=Pseudomonas huaxiensis TaxID=2213017 RepID=UPI0015ABF9CB
AGAATGQLNGAGNVQLDAGEFRVDEGTFSGALSGNGDLYKNSSGTLQLSGNSSLAGATTVAGGILRVNGSLGNGSVSVENGASLTGSGTLGGAVTVANGGHLSLASGSVLTLGSLVLNDLSNLDVALGAATAGAAGMANVSGNLTLDGKLNITDAGGFGIGVYRLFDYNGALIDNGLELGVLPTGVPTNELEVQTSVANQINLVAGGPDYIRFWDGSELTGNGTVEGGNGTWSSTNSNWTTINAGLNGAWNSSFAVFQGAAGTVVVDGTQSVTGLQFITDGYQLVGGGADSLQLVNGTSGYSTLRVDNGATATLDVSLGGSGVLNKVDSGTLVLNGTNTYSGGTRLTAGTLVLGNNAALGTGSLRVSAGTTLDSNTPVSAGNTVILDGDLTLAGNNDLTLTGQINGNGGLIKNGANVLRLDGNNSFQGNTELNSGTLVLGHNKALGSSVLAVNGTSTVLAAGISELKNRIQLASSLTLGNIDPLALTGRISGNGTLIKQGPGTVDLTGSNDFSGTYRINDGRLNLAGSNSTGNPAIDISTDGTLGVAVDSAVGLLSGQGSIALENNSLLTLIGGSYDGAITGTGSLNKVGSGGLILSGVSNISGATTLTEGSLSVTAQGVLGTSSLSVASGTTLGGNGTIDGAVTIADGGHLVVNSGKTLTTGNLTLNNDSNLDALLGAAVPGASGLLKVNGNLVLDGKLNVTDVGGFGLGVYRLIDYTGTLTDNGLALGTLPGGLVAGDLDVQTSVGSQVNLVVGAAAGNVLFWDGAGNGIGAIDGGNGTWGATGSNWTNASGNFNQGWNDGFAVFQGNTGTVTVEDTQSTTGLQFLTDGYSLVAGAAGELNLVNSGAGYAGVRVGSGNTATLDVSLIGSGTLNKLETGTLVLNGNNSYSGGTQLNGGTLVVGSNSALGTGTLTTA